MSLTTREEEEEKGRPLPAPNAFFHVATDICGGNLLNFKTGFV